MVLKLVKSCDRVFVSFSCSSLHFLCGFLFVQKREGVGQERDLLINPKRLLTRKDGGGSEGAPGGGDQDVRECWHFSSSSASPASLGSDVVSSGPVERPGVVR